VALNWFKKKKNSDENKKDQDNSTSSGETSFFERLKKGLSKTREILSTDIDELFTGKKGIDDSLLEELEELLITSDIGVQLSMDLIQRISKKSSKISDANQLKNALKEEMLSLLNLQTAKQAPETASAKPLVIMVIGVNGVGKTTTIGKLAAKFNSEGKKVLIAATDTFRAAAIEQLAIWAGRAGAQIVKHKDNADPASVAYDSIEAAIARDIDIVLVDTAGRIHTKVNLMEELKKIKRTISKKLAGAPHEILLVLDATTGQNALSQAELFDNALGVTGIALTKLDGTAKGGIVVSICNTLKIQLKYIGIGEKIDDLQDFNSKEFVDALF
jgi:fused signal recognition particle receptor